MKIKISKPLNITHVGFNFKGGIAEVKPEDEEKAKRIAKLLDYEIIEDTPKKAPAKKAPAKRTTAKAEVPEDTEKESN